MSLVVAVDGPAGSGKSSVSSAVAKHFGYAYLDTGAAYRAFAWFVLEGGIATENPDAVIALLPRFSYRVLAGSYHVGQVEVTEEIRSPRVTRAVSDVARLPEVREFLNAGFRHKIAKAHPGIVVEGRDITTVVAPDAEVRILLSADERVRVARRAGQLGQAASSAAQVRQRDARDARVVDFLHAAEGVIPLDSTHLSFEQTVQAVIDLVQAALGRADD